MDPDLLLGFASRFVHVATAIVLVGGTTALRFVVVPALANQPAELRDSIRQRWKRFVHIGIALFLISGLYNYVRAMPLHKGDGLYHALLGIKMMLAFGVFFLASVLVGRSAGTQKFRDEHTKWMSVLLLIAFFIVGISSFVRVRTVPVVVEPAVSQPD